MRVLRITPLWDWRAVESAAELLAPGEGIGGQAAQVLRITRATAALGVEQEVVTRRPAGAPARVSLQPGVEVVTVGRAGVSGVHRRNLAWLGGVLSDLPGRRRSRPDVVHVHASGIFEPLLAARAAGAILRTPLVLTLHGSAQATYVPRSRRDAALTVFTRAAERSATRAAARTLTLTHRTAARLAGTGTFEAMPDCIDAAAFEATATRAADGHAFLRATGVPAGAPVALYVARLSTEKGWDELPALTAAMPELHVLVCGDGPGRADLEARRDPRIHLAGAVAQDLVAAAMSAADVLVLPSRFEELGSVLIEAMAAGLVSVAFDVGGVAEAVEPDVTGVLVAPRDTKGLTDAVARVLADDAWRARARTEAPRVAAARFDQARIAERLVALYNDVAGT